MLLEEGRGTVQQQRRLRAVPTLLGDLRQSLEAAALLDRAPLPLRPVQPRAVPLGSLIDAA